MIAASREDYTCELCQGRFESDRSDEEALAETVGAFGSAALSEPLSVVCDDCWRMICPNGKPLSFS